MFEAFYGFTTTPFSRQIAPENLFPSAQVRETLARLNYLVRTRGFGLLTGEVGAGKSTAVRALSHQLDPARYRVLYVSQSGLTPRHLYRELCFQMGLKPAFHAADARRQLTEALWDAYKNHDKQPVIIIDEGAPAQSCHAGGNTLPDQLPDGRCLSHGPDSGGPNRTAPPPAAANF